MPPAQKNNIKEMALAWWHTRIYTENVQWTAFYMAQIIPPGGPNGNEFKFHITRNLGFRLEVHNEESRGNQGELLTNGDVFQVLKALGRQAAEETEMHFAEFQAVIGWKTYKKMVLANLYNP